MDQLLATVESGNPPSRDGRNTLDETDDTPTGDPREAAKDAASVRTRFGLRAIPSWLRALARFVSDPAPSLAFDPMLGITEHMVEDDPGPDQSTRPAPRRVMHVPYTLHRPFALALAFALLLGIGGGRTAAEPAELDPRLAGYPELTIRLTDETVEAPALIVAGPTLVVEENHGSASAHVFIMRLPDDVTDEQVALDLATPRETLADQTPDWAWRGTFVGNPDRADPAGDRAFALVDLVPGRYLVMDPLHTTRYDLFRAIDWTGFKPLGDQAPEADVVVEMLEMAFTMPETVPAGRTLWRVSNVGALPHEIAVFPVPAGVTVDDVVAAVAAVEAGRSAPETLGEKWARWSPRLVNGVGATSATGSVLAQFDLEPGAYAAVCFFPTRDGMPHLMVGMTRLFTVAPAA